MPTVDQFQSAFRAAVRTPYLHRRPALEQVLVVSDLQADRAAVFVEQVHVLLGARGQAATWTTPPPESSQSVDQLLDLVASGSPDLVISYRNVHTDAWQWPHSLGRHLDILTQATEVPVLVLPHPRDERHFQAATRSPVKVMAVSGHLAGDGGLVDQAVAFTAPGGTLMLAHVEDDATFERYMDTISKIPAIDTDTARETILAQLLKEPADYVESVREGLGAVPEAPAVLGIIETGHRVAHYRDLVEQHGVELLVLHTKDDGQDAMHGVAYPLAVELRSIPILML